MSLGSRLASIILLAILPCVAHAGMELPEKGSLKHPYLIMKAGEENAVRDLVARDVYARKVDSSIVAFCNSRLTEPIPTDERDAAGVRLKAVGLINKDLNLLSYVARVHGDEAIRQRAIDEMMAVCRFPDWSPSHFLDPSGIAFGVSICYDWLYDYLTPKQRRIVREALISKAIVPSFEKKPDHYFYSPTNWNSVCNCGIVAAALTVMDYDKEDAVKVIERCLIGNRKVLESYNPMGGYPEGYGYWAYGTNNEVLLLDMLEGVFGTDYGLAESAPGFLQTPYFILHMNGPFLKGFNYGDNAPEMRFHPAVFWFAQKNLDPSLLYAEQDYILSGEDVTFGSGYALPGMLVWFSRIGNTERKAPQDLVYVNSDPKIPLFIYRSSWTDKDAAYLGIRAGSISKVGHCHIDVGSFVYYKNQVRWVSELGVQPYALAEKYLGHDEFFNLKQKSRRWEVLREGADGHSIATFDTLRPILNCNCPFLRTFSSKAQKGAMMDLSSMYKGQVGKYIRMVYLDANDNLVVSEKFTGGDTDRKVRWRLVTESNPEINPDGSVVLHKNGKSKMLRMSSSNILPILKVVPAVSDKPWDSKNKGMNFIDCEFLLPAGQSVSLITTME